VAKQNPVWNNMAVHPTWKKNNKAEKESCQKRRELCKPWIRILSRMHYYTSLNSAICKEKIDVDEAVF